MVSRERLPAYPPAHLTVGPFYSQSKSFVKLSTRDHQRLCEGESQVRAEYIIQGTALRPGQEELNFYYIVSQPFKPYTQTLQRFALSIKKRVDGDIPLALVTLSLFPIGDVQGCNNEARPSSSGCEKRNR